MSQTGVIFLALFVAFLIHATMRGTLSQWLDVVGI